MLTNSSLAKTSSTPGKTQLINHYLINETGILLTCQDMGTLKLLKQIEKILMPFQKNT